jgi:EAL domain-containing protein (putative c-di-GMP-specific phosphodiesterase class I)
MAKSLNFDIVAEGIETEEQLAFLEQNDCEYAQGYFLSRPMSEGAFKRFIQEECVVAFEVPSPLAAS